MPAPLIAAAAANPGITSSLITAGSSLLGGLLGGKGKTKTQWDFEERRYHEKNRYKWLRKGAQNAGFNPLAVLGAAGGSAGNAQASATDFDQGSQIASAMVGAVSDYFANEQRRRLVDAQIDLIEAERVALEGQQKEGRGNIGAGQVSGVSGAAGAHASRHVPNAPQAVTGPEVMDVIPHATAFGANITEAAAADEAIRYRAKEEGMKGAYNAWRFPSYLPATAHIEELHGDLGGAIYGIATAPAVFGNTVGSLLAEQNEKRGTGYTFKSGGKTYKLDGGTTWLEDQQAFEEGNLWYDFFNEPMAGPGNKIPVSP